LPPAIDVAAAVVSVGVAAAKAGIVIVFPTIVAPRPNVFVAVAASVVAVAT